MMINLLLLATLQVAAFLAVNGFRSGEHDGVNSVRLLLGLCGAEAPSDMPRVRTLTDAAKQLRWAGVDAVVFSVTSDDVAKIPSPSIVLNETDGSEAGRLSVFLGISSGEVRAIVADGGSCIVSAMSPDRFLRTFRGQGVMIRPASKSVRSALFWLRSFAVTFLAVSCGTACYRLIQVWRLRCSNQRQGPVEVQT